jgi:hypothetical protein
MCRVPGCTLVVTMHMQAYRAVRLNPTTRTVERHCITATPQTLQVLRVSKKALEMHTSQDGLP